ncbi:NAD(P)-dependent oxidoreductase [Algoriphagus sediminis]|uniref:Saccharopine dehydrogenase [NAD(+), L-lysine-forming] n=1 Tax=Algoriphagus sediminis TaxID=3057113 RepID=A0ABT7YBY0_9BACT|nr:NAD(P)-dependent oxidoreductase [Algoriphagus sediminis]MDN3204023.1 NAD(P)-dependent oxidoreductase [Algoriphagus sediminis]
MKIGIIHEGKNPPDKRVPFTPLQLAEIQESFADQLEIEVQSSQIRSFTDQEYLDAGLKVVDDISSCDILFGVKEVPIPSLIPNKTYFFFSHTMKKQEYNRPLLQALLQKNIRMIDYEALTNEEGVRVVAFGRWAGIVGAYNAFLTYGKKSGLYDIKEANECFDLEELKQELKKVELPPIKIILTGRGKVGKGAREVLEEIPIREVSEDEFRNNYFEEPVFTNLDSEEINKRKKDGGFDLQEFYNQPELYESDFRKYTEVADILIGASYWDPKAPRLFELKDIQSEDFAISVIADITCDIDGSIPTTQRPSTIADPVYDVDRDSLEEIPPFSKQSSISVMAVDNLPCELPRAASDGFGAQLRQWVIPALLEENAAILERATICRDGDLTLEFMRLKDFVEGKE